jgi:hypothetical protein
MKTRNRILAILASFLGLGLPAAYVAIPNFTHVIDNIPITAEREAPTRSVDLGTELQTGLSVPVPAKSEVRVGHGEYMNIPWNLYLQADGTYRVPSGEIEEMAGSYSVIVFEGEFASEVGVHVVCTLLVDDEGQCPLEGEYLHLQNQGSFWDYEVVSTRARGDNLDDLRMAFGHDKWQNWQQQGIEGNPISVLLSGEPQFFEAGDEPTLDVAQEEMVQRNAEQRCSELEEPLEETPLSNGSDDSGMVLGAPGSFICRTLFVGSLTAEDDMVALWWTGARDGFEYWADGAHFYLVPTLWGETEVRDWVAAEFEVQTLELLD